MASLEIAVDSPIPELVQYHFSFDKLKDTSDVSTSSEKFRTSADVKAAKLDIDDGVSKTVIKEETPEHTKMMTLAVDCEKLERALTKEAQ